jgi:histidinol-phosphate phosphatase family protein
VRRAGGHGRWARPAVFVDRDGTLNREVHYLRRVRDLRLVRGAAAGVRGLGDAGFAVVVVTNQSAVARGLLDDAGLGRIHAALAQRLARRGATLAGIYVCPHHPEFTGPCRCRKPAAGLVRRAVRELDLDLARSYVVGDSASDLGLAAAVGARAVLVLTGHGRRTARTLGASLSAHHVAGSFRTAAEWIIDDARRGR